MKYNKYSSVIWKETCRQPSRQRMDKPACATICAMPTVDEPNHSAAGTLHIHHTDGHNDGIYCTIKIHQIWIWLTYSKNRTYHPKFPVPPK